MPLTLTLAPFHPSSSSPLTWTCPLASTRQFHFLPKKMPKRTHDKTNHEPGTEDEEFLKRLECVVCGDTAVNPILSCRDGHVHCISCGQDGDHCGDPICNNVLTKDSDLEKAVTQSDLKKPRCPNWKEGCTQKDIPIRELDHHLKETCLYRNFNCEYCFKDVRFSSYASHLKTLHPEASLFTLLNEDLVEAVFHSSDWNLDSFPLQVISFAGLDLLFEIYHDSNQANKDSRSVYVRLLHDQETAARFQVQLQFGKSEDPGKFCDSVPLKSVLDSSGTGRTRCQILIPKQVFQNGAFSKGTPSPEITLRVKALCQPRVNVAAPIHHYHGFEEILDFRVKRSRPQK